jgi:hypothetical protein
VLDRPTPADNVVDDANAMSDVFNDGAEAEITDNANQYNEHTDGAASKPVDTTPLHKVSSDGADADLTDNDNQYRNPREHTDVAASKPVDTTLLNTTHGAQYSRTTGRTLPSGKAAAISGRSVTIRPV